MKNKEKTTMKQKTHPTTSSKGYRNSRYNATKHGILSRMVVLPWEDARELAELQQRFIDDLKPMGAVEEHLVLELANTVFRKQRCNHAENSTIVNNINVHEYTIHKYAGIAHLLTQDPQTKLECANISTDYLFDILNVSADQNQQDVKEVQKLLEKAEALLAENLSYEETLGLLREDFQEAWEEVQDEYGGASKEALREFIRLKVLKEYRSWIAFYKLKPDLKDQILNQTHIPHDINEQLWRYETHLDRKFERILAQLVKLQDHRMSAKAITIAHYEEEA